MLNSGKNILTLVYNIISVKIKQKFVNKKDENLNFLNILNKQSF
jgi:hypothetical protein